MKEQLTVVKVGGKIVENAAALTQLIRDFSTLSGHKVLVHGGGRTWRGNPHDRRQADHRCRNAARCSYGLWWTGQ